MPSLGSQPSLRSWAEVIRLCYRHDSAPLLLIAGDLHDPLDGSPHGERANVYLKAR